MEQMFSSVGKELISFKLLITLYYKRFSILTDDNLKNMGRFRIWLLLEDNTWSTQYTIAKNSQYSDNLTDCNITTIVKSEETLLREGGEKQTSILN